MNFEINDLLEEARITLEVDALNEDTRFAYLHAALVECGIEPVSESWDDLLAEAEDAVAAWQVEAQRSRKSGRFMKKAPPKSGWKKVFGVLRKVGRVAGKTALWGGGAGLKAAGWALKGVGSAAQHVGQGMHNTNKKIAWSSPKKKARD
jgi:hypothetical protein